MADPEMSRGRQPQRGINILLRIHFAKNCEKVKNWTERGACPLISLDPPLEMLDYRVFPSQNFQRKTWSLLFKRHV